MSTTIESLELEVQSSSTSATNGIDALSASLSKLKNAVKGGVGLTAVAKQFTALNNALNGISGANAGNLNKLAQGLQILSSCGNLKLSPSVSTQITNIGAATKSLSGTDFSVLSRLANSLALLGNVGKSNLNSFISQLQRLPQAVQALNSVNMGGLSSKLAELVSALSQLSNMGKNNLTSFVTQLNKIPQLMENLKNVDMRTLYNQIQSLVRVFTPLATQMEKVSAGFAAFPSRIQRLIANNEKLTVSNNKTSASYINLWAKLRMAKAAVFGVTHVIASWLTNSNAYIENMNLFTASMGEYAESASKYAEQVGELMGIDPGEWMRNQGTFMTLIKGFGVAGDKANMMSRNLTQLAYDLASFENRPFEEAMQKVQSGIAGELEPLRRWGYDLSIARLQQEALRLGIDKSVLSMTQAEKAQLRYYAVMTQVTWAQGDMGRTLEAPANQLRILQAQLQQCSRAMGNLFLPILQKVLPYLIAFAKFLREIIVLFASVFNISLPEFDYSSITGAGGAMSDLSDAESEATRGAKKLKNALLGIDELNVLSTQDSSSGSGSGGTVGGGDLGIELPDNDKWLEGITSKADAIRQKLQPVLDYIKNNLDEILAGAMAIGACFLAWTIAKGVLKALEWLSTMKGFSKTFSLGFKIAGLGLFLDAWNTIKEAIEDIRENEANFTNVTKLISGFAEGLGAAFLLLGNVKLGGAALVVAGVTGIVSDISDMCKNGINWDNATSLTKNIGLFVAGIGLAFGNLQLGGIGLMISGVSLIVQNFKALVKGFTEGDFSEVNWIEVAAGTLMLVGGLILAFKTVNTIASGADLASTTSTMTTVANTTGELSTTVGSSLVPKLANLVKDLALGIIIIAEVAAAAVLIVGAIWVLGLELEQVGIAWQPVIDNGATVAIAMGIGTGILVAVGVVTALLGTLGGAVCGQIAIGIAILAELGVATLLFIAEIWAIGKGLDEIGKAWQPVLDNGETIATGIGLGTALLVGIGVVTAALGVATVASAGLLPLAIGLGTALLVELAAAFIIFTESLVAVADELSENLSPALVKLNAELPTLSTNMSNFVDFMTEFAGHVVKYTEVSAIAGLSATIDTIIGWFTEDPIDKLADDVNDIYSQTKTLNKKLNLAVPELKTARDLLKDYQGFLAEIQSLTDSNVDLNNGQFANMKTVGEKIVTGFVDGIKSKSSDFSNTATTIVSGFTTQLTTSAATSKTSFTTWATNLKNWFTQSGYGAINSTTFEGYAKNVVTGFKTGVTNNYSTSKSGVTTWADYIKKWFSDVSYGNVSKTQWETYAKNVVTGFSSGITSNYSTAKSSMTTFANSVKSWFETPDGTNTLSSQFYNIGKNIIQGFIDGVNSLWDSAMKRIKEFGEEVIKKGKEGTEEHSPSKAFRQIGAFVIKGFNLGLGDMMDSSFKIMDSWADRLTSIAPTLTLAVDTSSLDYFNSSAIAKGVSASVAMSNGLVVDDSLSKEELREIMLGALNSSNIASDVKRQADKEEQTIVQVGNRTVTDAVTTQKKANGYVFAT